MGTCTDSQPTLLPSKEERLVFLIIWITQGLNYRIMNAQEFISKYTDLPDNSIPLFKASLGIALIEYPKLDIDEQIAKLEEVTEDAKTRVGSTGDEDEVINVLNTYLFDELGFKGNSVDYYNPHNSLLNDVLERRTGIPITISTIYLEVAWNLGLDVHGVGFPGHFLVGCKTRKETKYLDPFNGGRQLDKLGMIKILDRVYHGKLGFDESFLRPVSKRMILVRMLNNMRGNYLENGNLRRALDAINCITQLIPTSAPDMKDRGLLNYQLRNYDSALQDFSTYLKLVPDGEESDLIRKALEDIQLMLREGR